MSYINLLPFSENLDMDYMLQLDLDTFHVTKYSVDYNNTDVYYYYDNPYTPLQLNPFKEKFVLLSDPPTRLVRPSSTTFAFFIADIVQEVDEIVTRYFPETDYLPSATTILGKTIGDRITKLTLMFSNGSGYYGSKNFSVMGENQNETYQKSGFVEDRENALVFYLPEKFNDLGYTSDYIPNQHTRYKVFVIPKSKIPTDCCIDVEMQPDKYYLV